MKNEFIGLRINKKTKEKLTIKAINNDRTLSTFIVLILEKLLKGKAVKL